LSLSPEFEERYIRIATTADADDDFWKDAGKSEEERIYDWKDIPIFFLSGWYGNHLTENIEKVKILKKHFKSPVKLQVGPWEHNMISTFAGNVDFGRDADVDVFWLQRLQWFDQTLKGLDTGLFDKPRIQYFVMGGGNGTKNMEGRLNHGGKWACSDSWPPSHVQGVRYYMHFDGSLSTSAPVTKSSYTTYTFDPRDPVPTIGGNFMEYSRPEFKARVNWMPDGAAQDQRGNVNKPFCRDNLPLCTREDVLVFQTPQLEEDLEVTGELVARLWVSSTAPDTDFTVKLIDVYPTIEAYPEGFAMNLQDTIVRMRYRNGKRRAELIESGRIYEVELPLNSTSNIFQRGHRIRVDVSSSNFPVFDVNLNTGGPLGMPGPVRSAENTLFHDKDHPSHVVLPIAVRG
jgi:predicted acyl esterase